MIFLISFVYDYDIIFGSDVDSLSQKIVVGMQIEFEMYVLGELSFFLDFILFN